MPCQYCETFHKPCEPIAVKFCKVTKSVPHLQLICCHQSTFPYFDDDSPPPHTLMFCSWSQIESTTKLFFLICSIQVGVSLLSPVIAQHLSTSTPLVSNHFPYRLFTPTHLHCSICWRCIEVAILVVWPREYIGLKMFCNELRLASGMGEIVNSLAFCHSYQRNQISWLSLQLCDRNKSTLTHIELYKSLARLSDLLLYRSISKNIF